MATSMLKGTAFLRLYQGGKRAPQPVDVVARVTASDGSSAHHRTAVLASEVFRREGAADFTLDVPTGELSPGQYRLEVEARLPSGEMRRRDLLFQIH